MKDNSWFTVMQEEMLVIYKKDTWELTQLAEEKPTIGLKWIFKSEFNLDRSLLWKKVRMIVKG